MSREDLDRLAAEHVMGLLEGEEAVTAEKLLAQDVEFERMVHDWRVRLGELDTTSKLVEPSPDLWARIEADLTPLAAVQPTQAKQGWSLAALWNSLGFWRATGLAGAAAALVLSVGLAVSIREQGRQPVLVAVLLTDANRPAAVVNAFADGRAELVPIDPIAVPPGRALQVWTLWDRARGPVSVGLMNAARRLPLDLGQLPKPGPDQLFEISLEPETGSPTGRPTGPVLMKGTTSTAL
jgi:anti-sigma-K factor RskA